MPKVKPVFPQIQLGHPLTRRLIGAWLYYEGSGNILHDVSGRNNHGTLTNMDPAASWTNHPKQGRALDYGGVADAFYVNIPDVYASLSGNVTTFATWIRIDTYDTFGAIVWSTTTGTTVYWQIANDTQVIVMNRTMSVTSTNFDDGAWHHAVFVSDGSAGVRFYWDGNLIGSNALSGTSLTAGAKTFRLGEYGGGASWSLDGAMSDSRFYDRPLSDSEIKQLFYDSYAMFRPQQKTFLFSTIGTAFAQALSETITITDTRLNNFFKVISDSVTTTDTIVKFFQKVITDSVTTTDTVATTLFLLLSQALSETITTTDTIVKNFQKVLSDNSTVTNTLTKLFQKILSDSATLTDTRVTTFFKVLSQDTTVTNTLVKTFFKVLSETLTVTETGAPVLPSVDVHITQRYITARRGVSASDLQKMRVWISGIPIDDINKMAQGFREILKDFEI